MGLFEQGKQFPSANSLERMARYIKNEKIFYGNNKELQEIYKRARELLKGTPQSKQLKTLYTAVNLAELLCTKPSDLLVGEPPLFSSGEDDESIEQVRLDSIIENNNIVQLIHEMTTANGFRGDSFLKVHYNYRQDFSELLEFGGKIPKGVRKESIIEPVHPLYSFPEESNQNAKQFKAVNIAYVQYEDELGNTYNPVEDREEHTEHLTISNGEKRGKTPYLYVERHIPNYIFYQKFQLYPTGVEVVDHINIPTYQIGEPVTRKDVDKSIVETGVPFPLVFHTPYKSIDTSWEGRSFVESVEDLLSDINDRITQISYILWKHADPTAYGPDLSSADGKGQPWGGKYIPLEKDDPEPGYMTWDAQLDSAFKELDNSLGLLFMKAETPQWLFGTTITGDKGGSGTSHTDGSAIRARFMPILSKVKRIRLHLDKSLKKAIYAAQLLELRANQHVDDFKKYEAKIPHVKWKDGIPRDDKVLAEVMEIRTGGKATIDQKDAIKILDECNDSTARETLDRIKKDNHEELGTPSIFNENDKETLD